MFRILHLLILIHIVMFIGGIMKVKEVEERLPGDGGRRLRETLRRPEQGRR